jgi:hypothetical protein
MRNPNLTSGVAEIGGKGCDAFSVALVDINKPLYFTGTAPLHENASAFFYRIGDEASGNFLLDLSLTTSGSHFLS